MLAEVQEPLFDPKAPLPTLWRFYGQQRGHLVLALVYYLIKQSPIWLLPIITGKLVDLVAAGPRTHLIEFLGLGALMALDIGQNIPVHYLYIRHLSIATRSLEKEMRSVLARRLQLLSLHFYHQRETGVLQTKVIRDVDLLQQTIQIIWDNLPTALISLIVALGVTAWQAPWFLAFYAISIPFVAFVVWRSRTSLQRENQRFRLRIEATAERVSEMLRLVPLTRAYAKEAEELQRLETELDQLRTSGRQLDSSTAWFNATTWSTLQIFNLLCLLVAGTLSLTKLVPMSIGTVILLTGLYQGITTALMQILAVVPQITKGMASFASLGEILGEQDIEDHAGKKPVNEVKGEFVFEHVSYHYPATASANALTDLSFTVPAGQMVAIVGPSGSGKSTLVNLLIGFLLPSEGHILLDGQDLASLDLRTYRRFLSVVPQETLLFHGTLRDNILYGSPDCSEERYQHVLDDAQVREFADRLPDGDRTVIGVNGATLSGGQRQRIAIARALIRDPRVLILDEATASLDAQSEVYVQRALSRLFHQRTAFVVAHRLATIERADQILVFDQGRIVEAGTHPLLLQTHGVYAHLHALTVQDYAQHMSEA